MELMNELEKALSEIVEKKVAEKSTLNLNSVLEFIRCSNEFEMESIFQCIENFHQEFLESYYDERLGEDDNVINKDDITVDMVEDVGILGDCYVRYVEQHGTKECIKDLLDNL